MRNEYVDRIRSDAMALHADAMLVDGPRRHGRVECRQDGSENGVRLLALTQRYIRNKGCVAVHITVALEMQEQTTTAGRSGGGGYDQGNLVTWASPGRKTKKAVRFLSLGCLPAQHSNRGGFHRIPGRIDSRHLSGLSQKGIRQPDLGWLRGRLEHKNALPRAWGGVLAEIALRIAATLCFLP